MYRSGFLRPEVEDEGSSEEGVTISTLQDGPDVVSVPAGTMWPLYVSVLTARIAIDL